MLDLTKTAKRTMGIKLIDGKELRLRMPTKAVFDALVGIQSRITNPQVSDIKTVNEIYELLATTLSNNLEHDQIDVAYIESILDFEDLMNVFTEYMKFASGASTDPN